MSLVDFVKGNSRTFGLIGNPVEHSASPLLHNSLFDRLGLPMIYVPFKVEKDELGNAVKGMKALGFAGFNVTVPYKKEVLRYLDGVSREALLMGAVNTVKCLPDGLYGYNTDADGFMRSFVEAAGTGFEDKRVLIIGAGGAARAIAVKIAYEKAAELIIANRSKTRAEELAELINENISRIAKGEGPEALNAHKPSGCDVVINTTPAGMYPQAEDCPVGEAFPFVASQIVYDAIYNPLRTKLLERAERAGCKTINGLGMLFYQAIGAFEIWTGMKLPAETVSELREAFVNSVKK